MLFYLKHSDVPRKKLNEIVNSAQALETPFGYRTYAPRQKEYSPDYYHHGSIWPWEQAYIALGAVKHNRKDTAKKTLNAIDVMAKFENHFIELFAYDKKTGKLKPFGCHVQLWTIAGVKAIMLPIRPNTAPIMVYDNVFPSPYIICDLCDLVPS